MASGSARVSSGIDSLYWASPNRGEINGLVVAEKLVTHLSLKTFSCSTSSLGSHEGAQTLEDSWVYRRRMFHTQKRDVEKAEERKKKEGDRTRNVFLKATRSKTLTKSIS